MEVTRLVTDTEKKIRSNRDAASWVSNAVYSWDTIQSTARVYRSCGGVALILYRAILGCHLVNKGGAFKLGPIFREATGLCPVELSRATSALEAAGYIKVERKAGHKNIFTLTGKGKRGLPPAYARHVNNKTEENKNE